MVTDEMIEAGIVAVRKLAEVSARRESALADATQYAYRDYIRSGQYDADQPAIDAAEAAVRHAAGVILRAMGPERTFFEIDDAGSDKPGHAIPESGTSRRGAFLSGEEWVCPRAVGNHNNSSFSWAHRSVTPTRLARAIRWAHRGDEDGRGGPQHDTREQRDTLRYALMGLAGLPIDDGYGRVWVLPPDQAESA